MVARPAEQVLGQIAGVELGGKRGSKTLGRADAPTKLTGMATLKKAIAQRDNLRVGRHDGVVAVVETLKALVNIESGSRDKPGLDKNAADAARLICIWKRAEDQADVRHDRSC